jgi:hypothetical protein
LCWLEDRSFLWDTGSLVASSRKSGFKRLFATKQILQKYQKFFTSRKFDNCLNVANLKDRWTFCEQLRFEMVIGSVATFDGGNIK